jgi:hypothetical protein
MEKYVMHWLEQAVMDWVDTRDRERKRQALQAVAYVREYAIAGTVIMQKRKLFGRAGRVDQAMVDEVLFIPAAVSNPGREETP